MAVVSSKLSVFRQFGTVLWRYFESVFPVSIFNQYFRSIFLSIFWVTISVSIFIIHYHVLHRMTPVETKILSKQTLNMSDDLKKSIRWSTIMFNHVRQVKCFMTMLNKINRFDTIYLASCLSRDELFQVLNYDSYSMRFL